MLWMRFFSNSDEILINSIWKVNLFLLYAMDSFIFLLYVSKTEFFLYFFLARN
jgi:hypothetical protein